MKKILLILLLSGSGLQAQTLAAAEADDAASRDEILRRAVREAISGGATNPAPAAKAPAPAVPAPAPAPVVAPATIPDAIPATPAPVAPVAATPPPIAPATTAATLTPDNSVAQTTPSPAFNQRPGFVAPSNSLPTRRLRGPGSTNGTTGPLGTPAPGLAGATQPVPGLQTSQPQVIPVTPTPAFQQPAASIQPVATVPVSPTAIPAPVKSPEQIIPAGEINFPATEINQVLEIYAQLVGRTILRPSALPGGVITLKTQTPLTKTEAIQALNSVLSMNGITMINVGDKFVKAVPSGQVFQEAAVFDGREKGALPEMGEYVTHIATIKYAKPSELVPILQGFAKVPNSLLAIDSSGILIIRDYAENVKRMLELIEQIDVTVPLDYISEVIPIKYALASDIASALGSLGGGTGTSIGHSGASSGATSSGNRGGLGTPGSGGFGGNSGFGSTPGSPGYNPAGGLGTPGSTGLGGARTTSFQDRLQGIIKRASSGGDFQVLGQTKIIADERTNSLLVFASKQDMDMITNIIGKLDVVLAQVLIEAIIMEVTLSDDQTLGISYLQNSPSTPGNYFSGIGAIKNGSYLSYGNFASTATNAAGALPGGFSYFANFGNDFNATLTAIADNHKVNVLSRPSIQTSHAVPASLQIGDTVPYVTGTYFNGVNGTPSSQYQQTFVGINLQVTPLINPDGLVVMDITQDIQQLGTPTTIDGNSVPTTTKRTAQAKVSVRDRDTIVLGGFISTTKTKDKSGVPLLMDIPVLGYLFRSTADTSKRVELIVMIRPTVLPNPGDAAIAATNMRNQMPAVRGALEEDRLDSAKRVKAGEKLQATRDAAAAKEKN